MVSSKTISVIIPNYNNEKYLPKCLEALFQNHADFEAILIDDASTDHSLEESQKQFLYMKLLT